MIWTPGILDIFLTYTAAYGEVPTVRDEGLLQSSIERPNVKVFGEEQYPTIHLKAAALMDSLCRNHSLVDGNKRCAWIAVRLTYYRNHAMAWASGDDCAYEMVIRASDAHFAVQDLAEELAHGFTDHVR